MFAPFCIEEVLFVSVPSGFNVVLSRFYVGLVLSNGRSLLLRFVLGGLDLLVSPVGCLFMGPSGAEVEYFYCFKSDNVHSSLHEIICLCLELVTSNPFVFEVAFSRSFSKRYY